MQASPGPANACILTINGGSSSIDLTAYRLDALLKRWLFTCPRQDHKPAEVVILASW